MSDQPAEPVRERIDVSADAIRAATARAQAGVAAGRIAYAERRIVELEVEVEGYRQLVQRRDARIAELEAAAPDGAAPADADDTETSADATE